MVDKRSNPAEVDPSVVEVVSSLAWSLVFILVWVAYIFFSNGTNCSVLRRGRKVEVGENGGVVGLPNLTTAEDDGGHPPSSAPSNHVLLIIDGCNGPIRFNEKLLQNRNTTSEALSLLQTSSSPHQAPSGVIGKRHVEVRLEMLPLLHHLVQQSGGLSTPLHSVSIVFDGVSQSKRMQHSSKSQQDDSTRERSYQVTSEIKVEITDIYDEADNVIVNRVAAMVGFQGHVQQNECPKVDWDLVVESMGGKHPEQGSMYVIHRTSRGPGKSRRVLQSVGLLREDSVACLFGWTPALQGDARRTALRLQKLPDDLFHPIQRRGSCEKPTTTISATGHPALVPVVVTDDVFLRERVVKDASGCTMSFDQLWILLKEQHDLLFDGTKKPGYRVATRKFW
jgi:hypothetical protein